MYDIKSEWLSISRGTYIIAESTSTVQLLVSLIISNLITIVLVAGWKWVLIITSTVSTKETQRWVEVTASSCNFYGDQLESLPNGIENKR